MSNTQITVVPMITSPKHSAYEWFGHQFESTVDLVGRFRHQGRVCRFSVTYLDETTESRRTFRGPIETGEYAFLVAQPAILSATPIDQPDVIEVRNGDLISIVGRTFRIQDDRALNDPRLVRVEN
ncbi:hypothetical protein IU433_14080 [Nocardia puris]|uniref:hypothetical protein n=1 Tax=Nocardia puris TaxID=208602 RepID=UPI001895EED6|nr:hypothetical protein [Nocardia puris]MBF6460165.1 hypothetical protein [Nocardia puris]